LGAEMTARHPARHLPATLLSRRWLKSLVAVGATLSRDTVAGRVATVGGSIDPHLSRVSQLDGSVGNR